MLRTQFCKILSTALSYSSFGASRNYPAVGGRLSNCFIDFQSEVSRRGKKNTFAIFHNYAAIHCGKTYQIS